jgi:hypothetical protein
MQMTMTKWQLLSLLTTREVPYLTLPDNRQGVLDSVQREDGSGKSFNLTVKLRGEVVTVHVRTTD